MNTSIGVDKDFFTYKGLNAVNDGYYTGRTDGFHLDVNAKGAEVSAGGDSYYPNLQVGISEFTTTASLQNGPYEKNKYKEIYIRTFWWMGWMG